jgi:hypothetical protein
LTSFLEEHPATKSTARAMDKLPRKISRHTLFMVSISLRPCSLQKD